MKMLLLRRSLPALVFALSFSTWAAAAPNKPRSVIHVVTIKWAPTATEEQIQKAITGVETMNYPGIKNVWTKPISMQLTEGYQHIIVMEFESQDALLKYKNSDAQKKWYEVYMPIRGESRTHDITN